MRRLLLAAAIAALAVACSQSAAIRDADPDQLFEAIDKPDTLVLDVRDVLAMGESMTFIKTSLNLPVNTLQNNLGRIPKDRNIYIIGRDAPETAAAAKLLAKAGYPNVFCVTGGMEAYAAKHPVKP
jgi:rhodanese-related sulfurtransferase